MSTTKSNSSDTANTVTAGTTEASPVLSTTINLGTAYGCVIDIEIVNGGTGPTNPGNWKIQVAHDGSTWIDHGYPVAAGVDASTTYSWSVRFGVAAPQSVRVAAFGNTGQNVTLNVYWTITTAI